MVKGFILQITCLVYCFPQSVDFLVGGIQALNGDNEIKSRMSWGPSVLPDTDSFISREDKGDREGIPHTHPIPQVIRLELFLRP